MRLARSNSIDRTGCDGHGKDIVNQSPAKVKLDASEDLLAKLEKDKDGSELRVDEDEGGGGDGDVGAGTHGD